MLGEGGEWFSSVAPTDSGICSGNIAGTEGESGSLQWYPQIKISWPVASRIISQLEMTPQASFLIYLLENKITTEDAARIALRRYLNDTLYTVGYEGKSLDQFQGSVSSRPIFIPELPESPGRVTKGDRRCGAEGITVLLRKGGKQNHGLQIRHSVVADDIFKAKRRFLNTIIRSSVTERRGLVMVLPPPAPTAPGSIRASA